MKKIITGIIFLLGVINCNAQSLEDTKDFIIEKVDANDPLPSYDNAIFFQNIMKIDAERLAGKTLSDSEFKNLFIYARDCYLDNNKSKWGWTVAQTIDLRDIKKVSTTKHTGEHDYYSVTVYLKGDYYSKEYGHTALGEPEWTYIDKMEMLIGDNKEAAQKIKKAIIHLGELIGISVTDGDLF